MITKGKTKNKRIVVIGGGTGTFVVLTALRDCGASLPPRQKASLKTKAKENNSWRGGLHLTAIVTMADSGGSTGRLRDQYGVLPPGDVRRALVALSGASDTLRQLFNYRFETGDLKDHSFGNIFLSALSKTTGSFAEAVKVASKILNIKGEVIPVTLDNINLYAKLADGTIIEGETNIDVPLHNPEIPIKKVWLVPQARINPEALQTILSADMIVIGPGDLYTSLIPNLLVLGVTDAIRKSKAKKVYVCNLMTKYGETHDFEAQDFVHTIERYLGRGVLDCAGFNNRKPSDPSPQKYRQENSYFVDPSGLDLKSKKSRYVLADLLDSGKFIRHNPRKKLAKVLLSLLRD